MTDPLFWLLYLTGFVFMEQIEQIKDKFEELTAEIGIELVELSGIRLGGHTVIRAFIHKPGGVTISDCKKCSRAYSDYLDTEDLIAGKYKLEVSSLGLDRPLAKPKDFQRRLGELVKLELQEDGQPSKNVMGKLVSTDEKGVIILIENQEEHFDYENIVRGKIVY